MDEKYKILISYSDAKIRNTLAAEFPSSFEIIKVASGEDALILVASDKRPDLVLFGASSTMGFAEFVEEVKKRNAGVACLALFNKPDPLALDAASVYFGEGKTELVFSALQVLLQAYFHLHTQLELLENLSVIDGLTMVPNRARFDEELERNMARQRRESKAISVVLLEMDCFLEYVKHYGEEEANARLQTVAYAIASRVKRSSDFQARYDQYRFAVLLYGAELENALKIAEELCAEVESLHMANEVSTVGPWITITAGVACTPPSEKLDERVLMEAGEAALQKAKDAGRNGVKGLMVEG